MPHKTQTLSLLTLINALLFKVAQSQSDSPLAITCIADKNGINQVTATLAIVRVLDQTCLPLQLQDLCPPFKNVTSTTQFCSGIFFGNAFSYQSFAKTDYELKVQGCIDHKISEFVFRVRLWWPIYIDW